MIEFQLAKIVVNEYSENQIVILKELAGERTISIVIGLFEVMAIERKVKNWNPPRPLTHDLIELIINNLDGQLERVVITDLQDGTYFAELNIRQDGAIKKVDCRPSDGIALAVRTSAPIFVEEQVLDKVQDQE